MSDSNSDSDEVSTYCTGSSTEISDSEVSVVEDNEQNVEPYQFEPAASDAGVRAGFTVPPSGGPPDRLS